MLASRVLWLLVVVAIGLLALVALQPALGLPSEGLWVACGLFVAVCILNLRTFRFYFRRLC